MKKHNTTSPPRLAALLAGAALLGLVSQGALAAGTASGTAINNLAKLSYAVSGTAQEEICSSAAGNSTGNGGTAATTCTSGVNGALNTSFVVDNKVNLTVAKVSDLTTIPGTTKQALAFTVTNNGNTAQRYALSAVVGAATIVTMSNVAIYKDVNADNAWDAGDTLYVDASTFGDVAADGSLKILIVADTPATATNGQTAVFDLRATTVDAGTTTVTTATAGADTPGSVDVVFADIATSGTDAGDASRDGKHSTNATYTIGSSVISVAKTATVLCDPYNGITNPKNIPGAIVQWTITVSNDAGASASATLATITDTLDANTTHDVGLRAPTNAATCIAGAGTSGFKIVSSAGGRTLGGAAGVMTNAADADGATIAGQAVTIDYSTALPVSGGTGHAAGELKVGESATVTFNVIIN